MIPFYVRISMSPGDILILVLAVAVVVAVLYRTWWRR